MFLASFLRQVLPTKKEKGPEEAIIMPARLHCLIHTPRTTMWTLLSSIRTWLLRSYVYVIFKLKKKEGERERLPWTMVLMQNYGGSIYYLLFKQINITLNLAWQIKAYMLLLRKNNTLFFYIKKLWGKILPLLSTHCSNKDMHVLQRTSTAFILFCDWL